MSESQSKREATCVYGKLWQMEERTCDITTGRNKEAEENKRLVGARVVRTEMAHLGVFFFFWKLINYKNSRKKMQSSALCTHLHYEHDTNTGQPREERIGRDPSILASVASWQEGPDRLTSIDLADE